MKEVIGVQYLRGLAALFVVFYHVLTDLSPIPGDEPIRRMMFAGGVDIFFVISGFIIWMSVSRPDVRPGPWWLSRAIRIAPLYWLTLLVVLAQLAVSGRMAPGTFPRPDEILYAFLFVFCPNSVTGQFTPYFTPGWSLNYEFFFYLLMGLSLFLRRPWMRVAMIVGIFAVLIALRPFSDPASAAQFRYTSPLQMEFVAGIGISILYPWIRKLRGAWLLGLLSLALAVGVMVYVSPRLYPNGPRAVYFGLPAALLVFGVVCLEDLLARRPVALFNALGDSSYSLFLSHTLAFAIPAALFHAVGPLPLPVSFVIAVVFAAAVGWLVFRYVEKPMLAWMRARAPRPHGAPVTS